MERKKDEPFEEYFKRRLIENSKTRQRLRGKYTPYSGQLVSKNRQEKKALMQEFKVRGKRLRKLQKRAKRVGK